MSHQLARYEHSRMTWLFGFARSVNRLVNLSPLLARTSAKERRVYDQRLRNIARLLRAAHIEFGYPYEADLYAGALAHDEGLDRGLLLRARRVQKVLRAHGVRRLITVDPHTTNMLRSVYPRILPDFDVQVQSYLEVLAGHLPPPRKQLDLSAAIHDSCVYARYEGVVEEPRRLLGDAGVRLGGPELSGRLTFCCGGPLETLFPGKSSEIAARRVGQLKAVDSNVVTAWPLCLANLTRVAPAEVRIRDISDHLVEAYCPIDASA